MVMAKRLWIQGLSCLRTPFRGAAAGGEGLGGGISIEMRKSRSAQSSVGRREKQLLLPTESSCCCCCCLWDPRSFTVPVLNGISRKE